MENENAKLLIRGKLFVSLLHAMSFYTVKKYIPLEILLNLLH